MKDFNSTPTAQSALGHNLLQRPAAITKPSFRSLVILSLMLCGLLGGTPQGYSDVTVKVDSTQPWLGYMNVWQTDGTTYVFGGAWAAADLRAGFIPTNSPPYGWPVNTDLFLRANTNTYNPADVYWNNPDGTPNKILEANFYRDVGTNFAGQNVTFTGSVLSNTLPAVSSGVPTTGWDILAVVKEFSVGYGTFYGMSQVAITGPGSFTVTRPIPAGRVCQYGFIVKGPNIGPASADVLKGVGILVEDADPAITTQPLGGTITASSTTNFSVTALGSAPLAYQWKTNGVNLVNGSHFTGVTGTTLTINSAQSSDTAPYVVTVSNTVTHTTVDSTPALLTVLDVLITTNPVSQRVEQGSTVSFSVSASSSSSLTYLWRRVINGSTNIAVGAPVQSGTLTPTLTLTNVQTANSGFYFVTITPSGKPGVATGATLLVKSYADYANMLENPGFENDPAGLNESPWSRYESTDPAYGHFQKSTDTYFGGGFVNVFQGTYVSYTTYSPGAGYSGIFQDVAASPGQVFTADMMFYNATGDPIPGPSMSATNENYLEVQFRAGADPTPIRQYLTTITNLTYNTPRDVWFQLQATNAGTYGFNPATENAKYLVAPAGTTSVRFQLTMHDIANSVAAGSIYYDSARLMLKLPASVNASRSGGTTTLSWKSLGSTDYQVQYKDSLDGAWQNLGAVVNGTGLVVSKTDLTGSTQRFYRVLTL